MKQIPIKNTGRTLLVDDSDYDLVMSHNLRLKKGRYTFYAEFSLKQKSRGSYGIHRVIMGLDVGDKKIIGHKDGNGLNCQKSNMRITDYSGNAANRPKRQGFATSKYKGVDKCTVPGGRVYWRGSVRPRNKKGVGKCFPFTPEGEIDAAKWRDEKAKETYGEMAFLNFP